jgi:hypothetical protein
MHVDHFSKMGYMYALWNQRATTSYNIPKQLNEHIVLQNICIITFATHLNQLANEYIEWPYRYG